MRSINYDKDSRHRVLLKKTIKAYASGMLSGKAKALQLIVEECILNDLVVNDFVKMDIPRREVTIDSGEDEIIISLDNYHSSVLAIVEELCDEGFLTVKEGRYSLNTPAVEMFPKPPSHYDPEKTTTH